MAVGAVSGAVGCGMLRGVWRCFGGWRCVRARTLRLL